FGENKIQTTVSLGVIANYFLQYRNIETLKYDDGHTTNSSVEINNYDVRPFTFSPFIAAGVLYHLTEKIDISLEPTFRYGITKLNREDDPISEHLWNVGVNAGIFLSL
ncbi:MAG: hypothetical protein H7Y00_05515, partial [Fimbriimonadaceae bacterium]|nr:hypothetical protein [Chitinophagales bacterium]